MQDTRFGTAAGAFAALILASGALAVTRSAVPAAVPSRTLLQQDFNGPRAWPDLKPVPVVADGPVSAAVKPVGTIDVAGSKEASAGVLLSWDAPEGNAPWSAALDSGSLPVRNAEADRAKLTLAFSLSASRARPVSVRIESFDAQKRRTGGLEGTVYPAAPDFHQRFALDLSAMKTVGAGVFRPTDPFVAIRFEVGSATGWPRGAGQEVRVDNVHYAAPAFYVGPKGKDTNDGRTEKTAFATPQRAIDAAGPGDIVLVMDGTYTPAGVQEGIARFQRPGTPAGWITLKNYPGHRPLFSLVGAWCAVRIWRSDKEAAALAAAGPPSSAPPAPAYIEVRGLHIRGEGDVARTKYPDLVGQAAPETNGNAISVSWRSDHDAPHHLRFADNLIEHCPGAGIGPGNADWVTIENNVVRDNCWTTIYATSGISLNGGTNFDGTDGGYTILIRGNKVSGNRCFVPWKQIGKISDGNGIIVDINQDAKLPPERRYRGRTLIQNNLCFNNGGSGIHTLKSKRVDIINNTVYRNSASPELAWGQLFVQISDDIRMINNVVVAPEGEPVNTVSAGGHDQNSTNIVRAHNLYFGGGTKPILGENDVVADPQFVRPSTGHAVADFRLKSSSPAIGTGRTESFMPFLDLAGKPRGERPSRGAYQK